MSRRPRLEDVVDRCIDDLATGHRSVEQCLAEHPGLRAELEPLLRAASAVGSLPRLAERAPDPVRRAAFMSQLQRTPQQPARRLAWPPAPGWLTDGWTRLVAFAAPAAAVVLVAFVLAVGSGGSTAHAATLTVFDGSVQRATESGWEVVPDGAEVSPGDVLRTSDGGRALLTFSDGSTAALGQNTEIALRFAGDEGSSRIALEQHSGQVWHDVATAGSGAYTVETPDVMVSAPSGLFETSVVGGATEVRAAAGRVEVAAGASRATLVTGESVRADDGGIDDRPALAEQPLAEVLVEAPFVASLIGPDGAATGARVDGVVFHQLPGVVTSDPGDGPQRLRVSSLAPGEYTLMLRRFGPGGGVVDIALPGGASRTIALDDEHEVRVHLDFGGDGFAAPARVLGVDRDPAPGEQPNERIVQSPRTLAAVPPELRRSEAPSTATGTTSPVTAAPGSPAPQPTRPPTATVTPGAPVTTPATQPTTSPATTPPSATVAPTSVPSAAPTPPTSVPTPAATQAGTVAPTSTPPTVAPTTPPTPATPEPVLFVDRLASAIATGDQAAYVAVLEEALASAEGGDGARIEAVVDTLDGPAGISMLAGAIAADVEGGDLAERVVEALRAHTDMATFAMLLDELGLEAPPPTSVPTPEPTTVPTSEATADSTASGTVTAR